MFLTLCLCASVVSLSCTSKPTDMRSLAPADSLVYLETNDVAAALRPIVDSKPFNDVAKYKPDLSALKGVQLAVAVTGFETSEEKLTEENSIGRIQPHFVAIADTHAWNYQAVAFAEHKLGAFVADIYDSEPTLEKGEKNGGKYFTWTAPDGRKAYALVVDRLIYFGNDESSIDKALAVRRGEADSITKTGKLAPAERTTLARGYVSTDGVGQIASLISVKFANESNRDSELQTAIVDVLPQLIRSTVKEMNWTATRASNGIEDKFVIEKPSSHTVDSDELMADFGESITDDIEGVTAEEVVRALAEPRADTDTPNTVYSTGNRVSGNRVEHETVSDLGFIGWIIAQLSAE
jgi:hypothetical protein